MVLFVIVFEAGLAVPSTLNTLPFACAWISVFSSKPIVVVEAWAAFSEASR